MKIAIAHDYLIQMGGAERVVEVFHHMYPEAPIFTTVFNGSRLTDNLKDADIRASWLQKIPGVKRNFKGVLPLYPMAVRDLDFSGYDIVLSSSSAFMKSIQVPESTFHLCYCHTPMRFAWDYDTYMERQSNSGLFKRLLKVYMQRLKNWDQRTSKNVNQFVANSSVVKTRIQNYYHRDSDVIFPPINTARFTSSPSIGDYYLIVSRLVSYKRIDLAVEAFNRNGLKLYIVGDGPDRKRLEGMAKGNVSFLGRLEDEEVTGLMSQCRAFVFPGKRILASRRWRRMLLEDRSSPIRPGARWTRLSHTLTACFSSTRKLMICLRPLMRWSPMRGISTRLWAMHANSMSRRLWSSSSSMWNRPTSIS